LCFKFLKTQEKSSKISGIIKKFYFYIFYLRKSLLKHGVFFFRKNFLFLLLSRILGDRYENHKTDEISLHVFLKKNATVLIMFILIKRNITP